MLCHSNRHSSIEHGLRKLKAKLYMIVQKNWLKYIFRTNKIYTSLRWHNKNHTALWHHRFSSIWAGKKTLQWAANEWGSNTFLSTKFRYLKIIPIFWCRELHYKIINQQMYVMYIMCQQVSDMLEQIIGYTLQKKRTALSKASSLQNDYSSSGWVFDHMCECVSVDFYFLLCHVVN